MPQSFVINEFRKFISYQGFIGSYGGVGMYGYAVSTTHTNVENYIKTFKLPAVGQINRIATIESSNQSMGQQLKAFAIGDTCYNNAPSKSFLLEFFAQGNGELAPYYYAPLAYNPVSYEQEIADDVVTIGNYVVFATRDTRDRHAPVNLRISDTASVLQNYDIDNQWQIRTPSYQKVVGKLRLLPLANGYFVVAYVVFDLNDGKYYLCLNRILLADFLAQINTIVSHKIVIDKDCSNLVDIIYEPDVNTLVALLNGSGESKIYHVDPYSTTTSPAIRLDYPDGELYSIDTIGCYLPTNMDTYVALGDDRFFSQDIAYGINIDQSCLEVTKQQMILQDSPLVNKLGDPIVRYLGNKDFIPFNFIGDIFYGTENCDMVGPEKVQDANQ